MSKTDPTRFLEEAPGVFSMTRLLALMAGVGASFILFTCCAVALRGGEHAAGIIAALSAASASAFAGLWAALRERSSPGDPAPGVEGL